jgi:hypothetical protein
MSMTPWLADRDDSVGLVGGIRTREARRKKSI